MDSVFNILQQKHFDKPNEIDIIKAFIFDNYKMSSEVIVHDKNITIMVPNAGLANTLRLRIPEIQRLCGTNKRLVLLIT